MNISAKSVLVIAFSVLSCLTLRAQGDWKREQTIAMSSIGKESLHRDISFLTDSICGGGGTGTGEIGNGFIKSDGAQNNTGNHITDQNSGRCQLGFVDQKLSDHTKQSADEKSFDAIYDHCIVPPWMATA